MYVYFIRAYIALRVYVFSPDPTPTVEQYYYGQNNTIRHACVSCVLDSLIPALQQNPQRKFTYVEMAFFSMWWDEQTPTVKDITRDLVESGQLAFVNGGWYVVWRYGGTMVWQYCDMVVWWYGVRVLW